MHCGISHNHLLLLLQETHREINGFVNDLQSYSFFFFFPSRTVSETVYVSVGIFVPAICAPLCPPHCYVVTEARSLLSMSHGFAVNLLRSDNLCLAKQAGWCGEGDGMGFFPRNELFDGPVNTGAVFPTRPLIRFEIFI